MLLETYLLFFLALARNCIQFKLKTLERLPRFPKQSTSSRISCKGRWPCWKNKHACFKHSQVKRNLFYWNMYFVFAQLTLRYLAFRLLKIEPPSRRKVGTCDFYLRVVKNILHHCRKKERASRGATASGRGSSGLKINK